MESTYEIPITGSVELTAMPGADGETEIQDILSVNIQIGKNKAKIHLDITNYTNASGVVSVASRLTDGKNFQVLHDIIGKIIEDEHYEALTYNEV